MKRIKKLYLVVTMLVMMMSLMLFGACSCNPNNDGPSTPAATAISIVNKPTEEIYYQPSGVLALSYEITPADAVVDVEWTSSNKEVATVRANGRVSHRGIGETTISVKVKDTEISDSFVLKLIEQPALKISLNGAEVKASYTSASKDLAKSTLDLGENDDTKVVFDTNDTDVISPAISLGFPAENALKAETLYKMSYTLQFASSSVDALPKLTFGIPDRTANDWYHVFVYNNVNAKSVDAITIEGVFTTPTINLDKLQLFAIDSGAEDYYWKGAFTISSVAIEEVSADDVTAELIRAESSMLFEQDKEFDWEVGFKHADDPAEVGMDGVFSHGGILRQWSSSNEEVIAHTGAAYNGTFKIVGVGTTTISATVFGVADFDGASIEVTVTAPVVVDDVNIKVNGTTVEATPSLLSSDDFYWQAKDFNSCLSVNEGTISIDGTGVSNPTNAVYRYIELLVELPENTLDASKDYTISYNVTVTAMTLKDNVEETDFRVGGGDVVNKVNLYGVTTATNVLGKLTLNNESGKAYIFHETYMMMLKDLKLAISDIEINEVVPKTANISVGGTSVVANPTLTACNDITWGAAVDMSSCVTVPNGVITIDGTGVQAPANGADYRLIKLLLTLPENTLDTNKEYTITYKVTATAFTLGDGLEVACFQVGGQGAEVDITGYNNQEVTGTLKIEDGKAVVFYECNQMHLIGLQLLISDISITEKQGTVDPEPQPDSTKVQVTVGESTLEAVPTLVANNDYSWGEAIDVSQYVSMTGSKITIDGREVVNPENADYRLIKLFIELPENTLDTDKSYKIMYKVTATAFTLGDDCQVACFQVGGQGAEVNITSYNNQTVSGTLKIENGKAVVFFECNQMHLKDLQLEISDITITEIVPTTPTKVTVNSQEVEIVNATLVAKNDYSWGEAIDFSQYVSATNGYITVDGREVVNPENADYRLIKLFIELPENTLDESKTYTITYNVTATAFTLGDDCQVACFQVGGQGAEVNITGYNNQTVSGTLTFESGKAVVFYECNQMHLKDLQLTISNIVITEAVAE